ncbi:MAG: hypothetical protein H6705_14220 [Myxococcales bacterium]|nr:hypothetical protein [Myxococcales bacterium]
MEPLIVAAALVAAALAVPRGRGRWLALAGAVVALVALAVSRPPPPPAHARYLPNDATATPDATHSSSRACRACHPAEHASWHRTFHRTMTQAVGPATMLAAFDGRTLTDGPRRYRVWREGDVFQVDMPRPGTNGETAADRLVRPVVMSTGSHHMQAYWVPSAGVDAPPEEAGRAVFAARCTGCHGRDGGAKGELLSLIGAGITPGEVAARLEAPPHAGLVPGAERAAVERFVARIQLVGPLVQFPFVWLVKPGRWVHEEHTFLQPPSPPAAVEPYGDVWSDACDQCHSVQPSHDWEPETQAGAAAAAELGIACEACHGAGRRHVERHANPAARYARLFGDGTADDIVSPAALDHERASGICGQCHGELVAKDPDVRHVPGAKLSLFADVVQYTPQDPPEWLREVLAHEPTMLDDAFWGDGTIRIAGRAYNAMALTGCFTRGTMSCLTCHSMHDAPANDQLRGPAVDDTPCTGCHPEVARDVEAHTRHPFASDGSRCYNCHMPHTTVGLLTLMRSHRVDSPSAVTSAWTGRPNACNLCHLDKTLGEVAETLTAWYGQPPLPGVADDLGASAVVAWALRGDAVQRGAAAWHMGWGPARAASGDDWQPLYLARLLDDPYSVVRAIAVDALRSFPGFEDFGYDYTGPPADRAAAVERAMSRWRAQGPPRARPSVFIRDDGIHWSSIGVLAEQRDDSPVRVNE